MTQISFYSGAADKLIAACRLCAKAVQQGVRVLVYIPDAALIERFDQLLWTFSATSFVPHCRSDDDADLVQQTPVVLSRQVQIGAAFDVLLNLHHEQPPAFDEFARLIEIAGTANEDKSAARERYRQYKNGGFEIRHYQLDSQTG